MNINQISEALRKEMSQAEPNKEIIAELVLLRAEVKLKNQLAEMGNK
jgi:hypothetical protein